MHACSSALRSNIKCTPHYDVLTAHMFHYHIKNPHFIGAYKMLESRRGEGGREGQSTLLLWEIIFHRVMITGSNLLMLFIKKEHMEAFPQRARIHPPIHPTCSVCCQEVEPRNAIMNTRVISCLITMFSLCLCNYVHP